MEIMSSLKQTVDFIQSKTSFRPDIGIVLGSGLGNLVNEISVEFELPYSEIPNFPVSTVKGHTGKLIFGYIEGKAVVAMAGRFHYYEGYSIQEVVFPIRTMKLLGVHTLFVSNASGGINPSFQVGDVMVITDHINLQPEHPLRGKNIDELGPRFPDMFNTYDPELIELAEKIAQKAHFEIKKGVYVGVQGPTFETPAEYKAFHILGGDAVGMSTVPEVIVARHCGIRIFGVSVISDMGYPAEAIEDVSHDIVIEAAKRAEPNMTALIKGILQHI